MTNKPSLFNRARPGQSTSKQVRGFMRLPGEVRNHIYHFYFLEDFRCEIAAKGDRFEAKEAKTLKLCLAIVDPDRVGYKYREKMKPVTPTTLRNSRPLGWYRPIHGLQTNWSNSLCALILVCKQIHRETISLLYHNTTFVFAAPRRIINFLGVVPKQNLSYITQLHLHYASYGHPRMVEDCIWQQKQAASWSRACRLVGKKLVGLRELKLWIKVNYSPVVLDLRQEWLEPLLQLRRLTRAPTGKPEPDRLTLPQGPKSNVPKVVKVHLETHWSGTHAFGAEPELADASSDLHRLFADAIARAILGWSEKDAMADFQHAWEGKYKRWQLHLQYSTTTW
ncbi:hypothetical protein BDV95DRAFT_482624 [Massariosphaeria phaeospora]|uniref:DUF7730 domain-containing protein n=1 Tax=Massariosphaeria phaeospora TaxID=100035 RepID=A0A7C8ID89_9PLEO|nr:hypothetical protein BDV95DRAFT_482624 [Massariosphaeria phaeospora]